MKDFADFKANALDFEKIHDYAVDMAKFNESEGNHYGNAFTRGTIIEMLRQYHEWLHAE